jgi:hypothetical protein
VKTPGLDGCIGRCSKLGTGRACCLLALVNLQQNPWLVCCTRGILLFMLVHCIPLAGQLAAATHRLS